MTKNNPLECWEPKNCGGSSSKCGDCITLRFQLSDNWVPLTVPPDGVSAGIGISNSSDPKNFPNDLFVLYIKIKPNAKRGDIYNAYICKNNIIGNKLYYLVADACLYRRSQEFKEFNVDTSKCVNLIKIDNSCNISQI